MVKETILILYSNYGDGHQQAAKALRDTLAMTQLNMEGILVDFMELTHPHVYPMSRYLFIQAMKKSPSIYGYIFNKTRDVNSFSNLMKKFNGLGLARLLSYIQTARPSMVVSTFPLAAGAMSKLKEFGLTDVPTTTVITDHTDHSAWVHPYTDHYIAGSEFVKQSLQRNHISSQQITVTGIPIRREFNGAFNRENLLRKHNLDPSLPTLLFMGGAYGLLDGASLIRALDAWPQKVQILIVCGRNNRLQRELTRKAASSKHLLHILGYIDYVHELMAISDVMITKPGGLSISEALAMSLPMVLYKPLPGQEQDNANFLVQAGAAIQADDLSDLVAHISILLHSSEKIRNMREQSKRIQKKAASLEAIQVIIKTCRPYAPQGRAEQLVPYLQI